MPANPVHHTATVDVPWDGPGQEAKLASPVTPARGRGMYAWHDANGADPDGDGYPDAKADSKFPHHMVGADGNPGAANLNGCRNGLSRLSGANVPSGDDSGIQSHLNAHLNDAKGANATDLGPDMALLTQHSYRHVADRVFDRPWALSGGPTGSNPEMLWRMASILRMRQAGQLMNAEELAVALQAAKGQNGPRDGAVQAGAVAVIPMYGPISQRQSLMSDTSGGTSIDTLRTALRTALNDPTVSSVVFDIDSPGGSTDGVTEFASELRSLRGGRKPIVGQVNTLAGSAAYWLASQMTEIAVAPSGEVGAIGIFAVHEDVSKAAEQAGIKTTLISAGPFKVEGNEYEPLTEQAQAHIQGQVDQFYSMFLHDVASGRRVPMETVASSYGEGRTLLAKEALQAGMVDRIATLEQSISALQTSSAPVRKAAALVSTEPAALAASMTADRAWNARIAKYTRRSPSK